MDQQEEPAARRYRVKVENGNVTGINSDEPTIVEETVEEVVIEDPLPPPEAVVIQPLTTRERTMRRWMWVLPLGIYLIVNGLIDLKVIQSVDPWGPIIIGVLGVTSGVTLLASILRQDV